MLSQESPVSVRVERGLSGFLSSADMDLGFLWSFNRGVMPRLVWRLGTLVSSLSNRCQASCRIDIGIWDYF